MIDIKLLQVAYHKHKDFIVMIGKDDNIKNQLRSTELKMYSLNIEQVYNFFNTGEKILLVSKDDLLKSIFHIKNSIVWKELVK